MSRIFKGTIANGATQYIGVPIVNGTIGVQVAWLDETSDATITLELTNYDADAAPVGAAGEAWEWVDSSETIAGPSGAAGATLINLTGINQRRARLKIVASATSSIEVWAP